MPRLWLVTLDSPGQQLWPTRTPEPVTVTLVAERLAARWHTHLVVHQRHSGGAPLCLAQPADDLGRPAPGSWQNHSCTAGRVVEPLSGEIVQISGTNAQREVFKDALLEAYPRAGRFDVVEALLCRRLNRRLSAHNYFWLARAQVGGGQVEESRHSLLEALARWRGRAGSRNLSRDELQELYTESSYSRSELVHIRMPFPSPVRPGSQAIYLTALGFKWLLHPQSGQRSPGCETLDSDRIIQRTAYSRDRSSRGDV